MTMLHGVGKLR